MRVFVCLFVCLFVSFDCLSVCGCCYVFVCMSVCVVCVVCVVYAVCVVCVSVSVSGCMYVMMVSLLLFASVAAIAVKPIVNR